MARRTRLKITPSSGNVFRDLGFSREEAEHLLIRSDLMLAVQKALERRAVKQAEAARILGVTQPRVSDLLRVSSLRVISYKRPQDALLPPTRDKGVSWTPPGRIV